MAINLIRPQFKILDKIDPVEMLRTIEYGYRICYRSEGRMSEEGYDAKFIASKIKIGHLTPLEHAKVTVELTMDRGVSHEIVRHRIASPNQESTRYCRYDSLNGGLNVIIPGFWEQDSPIFSNNPNHLECITIWLDSMEQSSRNYDRLMALGCSAQESRSVLTNSTKTQMIFTANLREWRHIFQLRALGTTGKPHPQMVELMIPGLELFKQSIPVIFDDLVIAH